MAVFLSLGASGLSFDSKHESCCTSPHFVVYQFQIWRTEIFTSNGLASSYSKRKIEIQIKTIKNFLARFSNENCKVIFFLVKKDRLFAKRFFKSVIESVLSADYNFQLYNACRLFGSPTISSKINCSISHRSIISFAIYLYQSVKYFKASGKLKTVSHETVIGCSWFYLLITTLIV